MWGDGIVWRDGEGGEEGDGGVGGDGDEGRREVVRCSRCERYEW